MIFPFSLKKYCWQTGQRSLDCSALPCSIHHQVRFPVESWNSLYLKNPATHLLKDPLW